MAAAQAIAARTQGTYGVGGVLLDQQGNVLKALQNNVVCDGLIFDPTAHGERQLIDWYFAEAARGRELPPPHEVTVVTSLDPCAMCTGAILTAGFNVVVAATDPQAIDRAAQHPDIVAVAADIAPLLLDVPRIGGEQRPDADLAFALQGVEADMIDDYRNEVNKDTGSPDSRRQTRMGARSWMPNPLRRRIIVARASVPARACRSRDNSR